MENIKTVLLPAGNIFLAIIVISGIVIKLAKYIYSKKNNNVSGDNMIVWETMPFMEKYHIRERLGRGDRHRMPKAARRHEIKYWSVSVLFIISYLLLTYVNGTNYINMCSLTTVYGLSSLIFIKMNRKKIRLFCIIELIICFLLSSFFFYLHVNNGKEIYEIKILSADGIFTFIIPAATILLILLYSLVKVRAFTVVICVIICIYTTLIFIFINNDPVLFYMPAALISYFYLMMLVFQTIYNKRAIKKITVLQK